MIIELQIASETLIASFREQMRRTLACQLFEFSLLETSWRVVGYELGETKLRRAQAADGTACVHVGAPNVTTHLSIRPIRIVQQLTVNTCSTSDLVAANGKLGQVVALHMDLVFVIDMDSCASMRHLCFRYTGMEPSLPDIEQAVGTRIPTVRVPLPIDRVLAQVMPAGLPLINAHLTLGPNDALVAIRMEFWQPAWETETGDQARVLPYWTRFYAGIVSDHLLPAEQWSVFVDQHVLVNQVQTLIRESFAGSTKTRLHSGPFGSWINNGGIGRIRVTFNADSIDACRCFTKEIDVNADITLDVDTTLKVANTLRQDIWVDVSPDFWDATCCIATAALFWPIVGGEQFTKQNVNQGEYLAGFLPFVAFIGALVQVLDASSKPEPPTGFTKDGEDGAHLFRDQVIDLGTNPTFGTMTLTAARAVDDEQITGVRGLLTAGTLAATRFPTLADIEAPALAWGAGGRCSRVLAASALFHLEAKLPGEQPLLELCGFEVIDDPTNSFRQAVRYERDSGNRHWLSIIVPVWNFSPDYWNRPYPCRIVVRTNGGIRIVSVAPPPVLSAEEAARLGREIQLRYVNNCYIPKYRIFEELEWPINPIIDTRGIYLWQIVIRGLPAGESLALTDPRNLMLGTMTVNAGREAFLNVIAPHTGSGAALTVRRMSVGRQIQALVDDGPVVSVRSASAVDETANPRPKIRSDREVIIRQTRLLPGAKIGLSGECRQLAVHRRHGKALVLAVTSGLIEAFDVEDPRRPVTEWTVPAAGVHGVVSFFGELLAWNDDGVRPLGELRAGRRDGFAPCRPSQTLGCAVAGRRLWLLRDGVLSGYDERHCEVARADAPDALGLAGTGDRLVLIDSQGAMVLDPLAPDPSARGNGLYDTCGLGRLAPVPALAPHPMLSASRADHTALLRVTTDGIEEVARYTATPWFVDAVRVGRVLAFPAADRHGITLSEAVQTASH
ncbi:hypothetical protein I6F07_03780 [Ensifer sp. IC4062]|nr:hypothetical protein [Ensifer sp. IC4062]MCA1439354.1 hypothetical protein [Ensifer sp. IC4062]